MWFKIVFILFIGSILTSDDAFAQQRPAKSDSTIYKDIESYSKKSKFNQLIYRLIFKPVSTISLKKISEKKVYKKLIEKPYKTFEGKTIRNINIETLDPFGYSVADTIVRTQNYLSKAGNKLHVKSQPVTIRNLLLIRQNQLFDSLLVKESERLVRSSEYVHDVSFFVLATSKNSDSVDIFIRESDNWSIIPDGAFSDTRVSIQLIDKNFIGFGHEFKNDFTWNHTNDNYAYTTNYFIPNIRNTFVSSTLHYSIDELRNFTKSFVVDRPFFSPITKWAAGVNFTQQFRRDYVHTPDSLLLLQRFKLNTQDYWAGSAIGIFKGNTKYYRTTNFISTVRFLRIRYLEKPLEIYDMQHFYNDENFYMTSIGISSRKYVQDKFIFRFGVTEDVPIGKVISLTCGYQEKNKIGRLYLGARISSGHYYPWGYLSSNYEYGTFFRASHTQQGIFSVSVNYFTGLIEIGTWKFRQFVKPQVIIGINRYNNDSLTLNDGYGLDGFNSSSLSGTSRILLTLQTQSYTRRRQ